MPSDLVLPECEKLDKRQEDRLLLLDFLEWLETRHLVLAEYGEDQQLSPHYQGKDALVLEYLGVDADALEAERRRILAACREAGAEAPSPGADGRLARKVERLRWLGVVLIACLFVNMFVGPLRVQIGLGSWALTLHLVINVVLAALVAAIGLEILRIRKGTRHAG